MPAVETPAHLTKLYIHTGTSYTEVKGLKSFVLSGSDSMADVMTNADSGWGRDLVTKRQLTAKVEFNYLADSATGAADTGQAALLALAEKVGIESEGYFKIEWAFNTTVTRYFKATAKIDNHWGGASDIVTLQVTLTLNSKLSTTDLKT